MVITGPGLLAFGEMDLEIAGARRVTLLALGFGGWQELRVVPKACRKAGSA